MNSLLLNKKKRPIVDDKGFEKEEAARIYAEYIRSFEPEVEVKVAGEVDNETIINSNNEDCVFPRENKRRKKDANVETNEDFTINEQNVEKEKTEQNTDVKEIDKFLEEIKHKQKIWDEKKHLQERIEQNISIEEKKKISKRLKELERNDVIASYYHKREMFANLFINNLSPEATEEFLCKKFGTFGPIHSVKIMYPRSEEEKKRNRLSGFVCFENKEDAEVAKDTLNGTEMLGYVVKVGWSKAIPKMTNEKNEISDLLMNLNKMKRKEQENENANENKNKNKNENKNGNEIVNETVNIHSEHKPIGENLIKAVDNQNPQTKVDLKKNYKMVKLSIPENQQLKEIINLLAEHVLEAGYIFEEAVKKNEKNNGIFNFLFNENDLSNYYRWRVYSFFQGDTLQNWRTEPFQIFKNGTIYIPPPLRKKMIKINEEKKNKEVELSTRQKQKLVNILKRLNKKRVSICRAMIFCSKHSDASTSVIKIIADYLTDVKQDLLKKVNVMYLLSDLLHNCSNEFYSLWSYRKYVEMELPRIFYFLKKHLKICNSQVKAKLFIDSILDLFSVWESWALYDLFFMNGLKCFLSYEKIGIIQQQNETDESLYNKDLDGEKILFFDEIKIYPLHLRENAFLYFQQDDNQINKLCEQRGLYYNEQFTKMKKIKYLLTYDEFCAKTTLAAKTELDTCDVDNEIEVSELQNPIDTVNENHDMSVDVN